MKIETFEMERWQSTWEHRVEYNLSESGVEPIRVRDLLRDPSLVDRVLDFPAAYSQSNGTPELRTAIAAMYQGADPDHILVTNGSAEANFLSAWHLIEPGDDVVVMLPNYMQIWGLGRIFGATVKPLWLREDLEWQFDPEALKETVTRRTKLIAVCNPNNPTGAIMKDGERRALLDAAVDADAWLLADEVYLGSEREGPRTESLWGVHEKTLITNGLSKAYGLPGLRIGWIVGPPGTVATLWSYHDYTTLTPTYLSDRLAQIALEPDRREEILARTRSILRANFETLRSWIESLDPLFAYRPPEAGAICYLRYAPRIGSTELAMRLLNEKSTLIVPGDQFKMDGYIRIGMGNAREYMLGGLRRIGSWFREWKGGQGKAR